MFLCSLYYGTVFNILFMSSLVISVGILYFSLESVGSYIYSLVEVFIMLSGWFSMGVSILEVGWGIKFGLRL